MVFEPIVAELKGFEVEGLSRRGLCDVTAGIGRVRGALDALEVRVASTVDDLGDDGGDAESMMRSEGRVSKREAARRKRRADRLKNMPNTQDKLADGDITAEHADELAKAAAATSEAEVDSDEGLLANAKARPADLAGRDIRDWTRKHQTAADREAKHRRQRDERSLSIFAGDDDLTVAHCRTDPISGERLRARVEQVARRLHRQDLDHTDHPDTALAGIKPRTWEQLRHDALMILTGIDTPNAAADSQGSDPETPAAATDPAPTVASGPVGLRNQVVVVVDADVLSGADPNGRCEIPGVGPLPVSVLSRLMCDAEIFGHIFDGNGVSLWHGRGTRTVSPQQWRALLARDRGCVLCGAHPGYCEAHHIAEWIPTGPTDIENLALVCSRDHHLIHDHNLTLTRAGPHHWTTTPKPTNQTPTRTRRDRERVAA